MGRRKKYFTESEKKEANRQKVKEYYYRNKAQLDARAKEYYWLKKKFVKFEKEITERESELGTKMSTADKKEFVEKLETDLYLSNMDKSDLYL